MEAEKLKTYHTLFRKNKIRFKKNLPLKIAFISDAVYPYNKGGKEKRLYEISTRLAAMGYDVTIYTMKWWKGFDEVNHEGVKMRAICPYYKLYSGERRSIRQAQAFGISCLKLVIKSFDIVDVDQMPFYPVYFMKIVCMIRRKHMFATWHEVWGLQYWMGYMGWKGIFGYLMEKFSVLLPDTIIASSVVTRKRLRTILNCRKPIAQISLGVDMQKASMTQIAGPAADAYDVVFAGRLLKHKNADLLIKAIYIVAQTIPGISCLIIGEGPEKKNLQELAAQLQKKSQGKLPTVEALTIPGQREKNVEFRDFVERDDELFTIMKSAKVFVLPSIREGFGLAALEANACGIPVITIDTPENALHKYIRNGRNGILTKADADSIAEAILTTLEPGHDWRADSVAAARLYDWNHVVAKLKAVYGIG